jgi:hypothetical protein
MKARGKNDRCARCGGWKWYQNSGDPYEKFTHKQVRGHAFVERISVPRRRKPSRTEDRAP